VSIAEEKWLTYCNRLVKVTVLYKPKNRKGDEIKKELMERRMRGHAEK
jgi:hypothetical protein